MSDFYGSETKYFIGVVKDISDPLDSNRVRVRIKGIHPEDPNGDNFSSDGVGGGSGSGGNSSGGSGSTSQTSYPALEAQSLIKIDRASLPKNNELGKKISQRYTLAQLTTQVTLPGCAAKARAMIGNLSDDIIFNLANLATNVLDPLKEQFPTLNITNAWRPNNGGNHAPGYAADVQLDGRRAKAVGDWIQASLRGRFNFMIYEPTWIHIQLGGRQGSLEKPLITTMFGGSRQ